METLREHRSPRYLELVLPGIPRILSLLDRAPLSPSRGSFHRSYWHHRTSDFPSAVTQLGAHALALLWKHAPPEAGYRGNERILDWSIEGIEYAIGLQHDDGSFDEWYPNERGWAGPTAYVLHALIEARRLLGDRFPARLDGPFRSMARRAATFLLSHEETHVLANHHAISLLAVYESFLLLGDSELERGFEKVFAVFRSHCHPEGWALEYDGADVGYLSATVSFLARLHRVSARPEIPGLVEPMLRFMAYFTYPDGSFAGPIGTRSTSNDFAFGFEYWERYFPLSGRIADQLLKGLAGGQLIQPSCQEDHYFLYRAPEFLESWLESLDGLTGANAEPPALPWEGADFERYFPASGLLARKSENKYWVAALSKGGVLIGYDLSTRERIVTDAGWIARAASGKVVTSQWNGSEYRVTWATGEATVTGKAHYVPMNRFTPLTLVLFRLATMIFGWNATLARKLKSLVRSILIFGAKTSPIRFTRKIRFSRGSMVIEDEIEDAPGKNRLQLLEVGGTFSVRFVPQSNYFERWELKAAGRRLNHSELRAASSGGSIRTRTAIEWKTRETSPHPEPTECAASPAS